MKLIKVSLLILGIVITSVGNAQTSSKMVTHIIKPGETISSLSRIYHVKKDDIFKLNNLNDRTVLHIGQKIIVPIGKSTMTVAEPTQVNIDKTQVQNFDKNKYLVVAGDNLSRIAKRFHVSEKQIKDWNGLKNDIIKAGSYLIITDASVSEKQPLTKSENKPVEKEVKPIIADVKPSVVEPVKKTESITTTSPVIKPTVTEQPTVKEIKTQSTIIKTANSANDFFEKQFISTQNSIEGLTGIFKTIAGWQDKKYYVLLNNIQSGSVVKVTANNKTVYAKVLGPLPNVKDDNNLALRVSDATAAALGVTENRFTAKIEF